MTGLTTWLLMELTYLHALPPDLSTVSNGKTSMSCRRL